MLIACSACATVYDVDPASLGTGRRVRCSRCAATWFATAEAPNQTLAEAAPGRPFAADVASARAGRAAMPHDLEALAPATISDAPPLVPPLAEETGAGATGERVVKRRRRLRSRRKPKHHFPRWAAPLLLLFTLGVAIIQARADIVRYLPRAAAVFSAIGLAVE